jgi:hypothetical protein
VASPGVADRPAGGWPPEGRIVMTPQLPLQYYPFSVCLFMGTTFFVKAVDEATIVLREVKLCAF